MFCDLFPSNLLERNAEVKESGMHRWLCKFATILISGFCAAFSRQGKNNQFLQKSEFRKKNEINYKNILSAVYRRGPGCIKQLKITRDQSTPFPVFWGIFSLAILNKSDKDGQKSTGKPRRCEFIYRNIGGSWRKSHLISSFLGNWALKRSSTWNSTCTCVTMTCAHICPTLICTPICASFYPLDTQSK